MRPSEALKKHRAEVRALVDGYPVANPRLFGSTARGEDREDSDLDIIVQRAGDLTYFDLAELEERLTILVGVRVDVRTEGEFSDRTLKRISREFVPL
ncbi:MAG: nucleotidyltransferase family protein [Phyllobacteriaceae bacterium]|nr:nucleotidyltransferase family protein [Phyllobacteriaceae bacterium]